MFSFYLIKKNTLDLGITLFNYHNYVYVILL